MYAFGGDIFGTYSGGTETALTRRNAPDVAHKLEPLRFDRETLEDLWGGACGDRSTMPEGEDELRDEVIKALRDRVEGSRALPEALAECFRATNPDFSVAEPREGEHHLYAVLTKEPIGPDHLMFPAALSRIVVGVSLLEHKDCTIGYFGVLPKFRGQGFSKPLLHGLLAHLERERRAGGETGGRCDERKVTLKADCRWMSPEPATAWKTMVAAGERAFFYNFNSREFSAINLESPWAKFTCGARAYYYSRDTKAFSLKAPPEGISGEEEEDAGEFEEWFRRAGKFDSGAIRLGERIRKFDQPLGEMDCIAPMPGGYRRLVPQAGAVSASPSRARGCLR